MVVGEWRRLRPLSSHPTGTPSPGCSMHLTGRCSPAARLRRRAGRAARLPRSWRCTAQGVLDTQIAMNTPSRSERWLRSEIDERLRRRIRLRSQRIRHRSVGPGRSAGPRRMSCSERSRPSLSGSHWGARGPLVTMFADPACRWSRSAVARLGHGWRWTECLQAPRCARSGVLGARRLRGRPLPSRPSPRSCALAWFEGAAGAARARREGGGSNATTPSSRRGAPAPCRSSPGSTARRTHRAQSRRYRRYRGLARGACLMSERVRAISASGRTASPSTATSTMAGAGRRAGCCSATH